MLISFQTSNSAFVGHVLLPYFTQQIYFGKNGSLIHLFGASKHGFRDENIARYLSILFFPFSASLLICQLRLLM